MASKSVVFNLLRLKNHLQILSLDGGPPMKIVPLAHYGLIHETTKIAFAREPPGKTTVGLRPQVENH